MYTEIDKCQICGNYDLNTVFSLGMQYLIGVFSKSQAEKIT